MVGKATSDASPAPVVLARAGVGDPASRTDAVLLEKHGAAILEALARAAREGGAERAVLYLGGVAASLLEQLRVECRRVAGCERGEGDGRRGEGAPSGAAVTAELSVEEAPAALVCMEKSAFVAAVGGGRPVPALEPAGDLRLGSRPAVILEVRDLARQAGLSGNLFTLVVAAGGPGRDPASTAVVEAPEGATLQQIIFELGGGLPEGKELKAVRLGGPAGGFLPASLLDTVATEEALARAGVRLGSATLEAISADSCLVSLAGEALELLAEENCARCVVCREGTMQMAEILGDLTAGRSRPGDLEVLAELARALELLGKCDWGRCAAEPVLTALAHFRDEFESHARSRTCPAGVCRMAGEAR